MNSQSVNSFPPEVVEKLGFYVYRLIDPRDGETFYVGKGYGKKIGVFAHIRAEGVADCDGMDNKIKRIREILLADLEVSHVIHRHGMDEATALEVESALIDAYPGLTNLVGGARGSDYGATHAQEVIRRYAAEPAVFHHKALLISVGRSADERPLYEATRYAWKLSKRRAVEAEVILPTVRGIICGAFVADDWLQGTAANFPDRATATANRIGLALWVTRHRTKSRACTLGNVCPTNTVSPEPPTRFDTLGNGRGTSGRPSGSRKTTWHSGSLETEIPSKNHFFDNRQTDKL